MNITITKNTHLLAKLNQHVHNLHVEAYPEYFKPYNYDLIKSEFDTLINVEKFEFLLMEVNNEAIGYAWIEYRKYRENAFKLSYNSVYIHQISISSDIRGKGYGTALMKEIEQRAIARNIHKVELDYWSKNVLAQSFYEKQGFTPYVEHVFKDI